MPSFQYSVSVLVAIAGTGVASDSEPLTTLEPSRGTVNQVAHIYYNAVSGERVVTLLTDGQAAPADAGSSSSPVWSALVQNMCEAEGYTTSYFFGIDDATGGTPLSTGTQNLDYADIQLDTVVDCIQINWTVAHPDTDNDADGVGDGVEELAGNWIVWDADNGRAVNQCVRLPLVDILFFNLPGNLPENQQSGQLSAYTMDVDLVGFGTATDLSFEIGDSDGDCQSAAYCNNDIDTDSDGFGDGVSVANADRNFDGLPDSDLDGDGLFDWSWTVQFIQPGQGNDFDSDFDTGSLPGSNSDTIGIGFAAPEGSAVDNGDGTWTWNIDELALGAGTGAEDRFAIYEPDGSGGFIYNAGYWFGGFACTGGLISTGGAGYTPPAMFQFVLYGPPSTGCGRSCPSDFNCDYVINFFDVSAFLVDWLNGGDYNGDGSTDFFDVTAFLTDFNAGCP
jgi:hypothetical protein